MDGWMGCLGKLKGLLEFHNETRVSLVYGTFVRFSCVKRQVISVCVYDPR